MTTTREMTHQTSPAPEQSKQQEAATSTATTAAATPGDISRGERIFKWMTYGGIAAGATFFATLKLAYWQKYSPGPKFYHSAIEWLQSKGLSAKSATTTMETTNLMHGGNAMIIPVAIAEYFHKPIVGFFNRVFGGQPTPADKDIPKQTLGSLIKGRVIAWGVVLLGLTGVTTILPKPFLAFENKVGELLCKILSKPTELHGVESKTFRYGKIAALDIFATIASATLLFIGSRFFAQKAAEKKLAKTDMPAQAAPQDTPAHAPSVDPTATHDPAEIASHKPHATIRHTQHHALVQQPATALQQPGHA